MKEPRIIFASGVVTSGRNDEARVLSCRHGDVVAIRDAKISAFNSVWGEWHHRNAYREIRLSLTIYGRQIMEGEKDSEPMFFEFARKIARRRQMLSADIGVLFFNFAAAHAHLRTLLHIYARLTTAIGPELPFERSPVCTIRYPEAYAAFDACLASLRSFAYSSRFIIWRVLGRAKGLPRNLRSLACADLPHELSQVIQNYLDASIDDLTEYRDNSIHYAPPGAHMAPMLLWSRNVIHAQVWLPHNPDARSLKRFRYDQKDAFVYARSLLEQSYQFCDELLPVLDEFHRKHIREKRRAHKAAPARTV